MIVFCNKITNAYHPEVSGLRAQREIQMVVFFVSLRLCVKQIVI